MSLFERPAGNDARGASVRRGGLVSTLRVWLGRHAQVFFYALGQLSGRPFATLMTAAVIGIALALPAGLHVLLQNARQVTAGWDSATQISLFLKAGTADNRAQALVRDLERHPEVGSARYISPAAALEEFRRLSGFGEALDALTENPLPGVVVVNPVLEQNDAAATEALLGRLQALPEVESAQLDMQWVKRLYALMDVIARGVWVLASLLGLAVLLVVGNTIRLAIQNRRDEIVITKLVGGTDAFIRRPFLYSGLWYGLFGGLIAILLVTLSLGLLSEPAQQLTALYHSAFQLQGLDLLSGVTVLAGGILLGLLGSWLAVGRHLRDIEPT